MASKNLMTVVVVLAVISCVLSAVDRSPAGAAPDTPAAPEVPASFDGLHPRIDAYIRELQENNPNWEKDLAGLMNAPQWIKH